MRFFVKIMIYISLIFPQITFANPTSVPTYAVPTPNGEARVEIEKHMQRRLSPPNKIDLSQKNITNEDLSSLKDPTFRSLNKIELSGTNIKDEDLTIFNKDRITVLGLLYTSITQAGLAKLQGAPLQELSIGTSNCGDEMVPIINSFALTSLMIACPNLTERGIKQLNLPNLKFLGFVNTSFSKEALESFDRLQLTSLSIAYSDITDEKILVFEKLRTIKSIRLDQTQVTENGLAGLARLRPDIKFVLNSKGWIASTDLQSVPSSALTPTNYTPVPEGILFDAVSFRGGSQDTLSQGRNEFPRLEGRLPATPSYGSFTSKGFIEEELRPLPEQTEAVVFDSVNGKYFILSDNKLHHASSLTGSLTKTSLPEGISWPKSIALNPISGELILMGNQIFSLNIVSDRWSQITHWESHTAQAFSTTVCNDGNIHRIMLGNNYNPTDRLEILDKEGAFVRGTPLSSKLPIYSLIGLKTQMFCRPEGLYILLQQSPNPKNLWRLFRIFPDTGFTEEIGYSSDKDPYQEIWPGMPNGPQQAKVTKTSCLASPPFTSVPFSYLTPDNLVNDKKTKLHVIAVGWGKCSATDTSKELAEIMKEQDPRKITLLYNEYKRNLPPCTLSLKIGASQEPISLWLQSENAVQWEITKESPNTKIENIWLVGSPKNSIRGIDLTPKMITEDKPIPILWYSDLKVDPRFVDLIQRARRDTGLRESSYQGCGVGEQITVPFS